MAGSRGPHTTRSWRSWSGRNCARRRPPASPGSGPPGLRWPPPPPPPLLPPPRHCLRCPPPRWPAPARDRGPGAHRRIPPAARPATRRFALAPPRRRAAGGTEGRARLRGSREDRRAAERGAGGGEGRPGQGAGRRGCGRSSLVASVFAASGGAMQGQAWSAEGEERLLRCAGGWAVAGALHWSRTCRRDRG